MTGSEQFGNVYAKVQVSFTGPDSRLTSSTEMFHIVRYVIRPFEMIGSKVLYLRGSRDAMSINNVPVTVTSTPAVTLLKIWTKSGHVVDIGPSTRKKKEMDGIVL